MIGRRTLLLLSTQLLVVPLTGPAPAGCESLEYRGGRLRWSKGSAAAAVGRSGVRADKREGDGATPAGSYPLISIFYRADRVEAPVSQLPAIPLTPKDAWVDDPADAYYNRLVTLPYPAGAEPMWREDELYDALVVIGYNTNPVIAGAGSAIFLHIASPDFTPTVGCVAVKKEVLLGLLPLLGPGSKIMITP